jgi:hypothetical protein
MTVKHFSDISTQDNRMYPRPGFLHSFSSLAELEAALLADSGRVLYPVDSQVSYRLLQICTYGEITNDSNS